jgi:tagatose 6-phosphate kinase
VTSLPSTSIDDTQPVLLCITPSPAIDRTAYVANITAGEVLRPHDLVVLPGGKGVNAARAATRLGGRVITTGIAGGHAGRWIVDALAEEGLSPNWSFAASESRSTYVTVADDGESVMVYERPTLATDPEFEAFLALLGADLLPRSGRAIVAGSVPAGVGASAYGMIVDACREAGVPLLVDASGDGLLAALDHRPDLAKVGRVEVIEAGLIAADDSAEVAARALVAAGARLAIVTDGASGVAAADADTDWSVGVPVLDAVNAVGSGDAFNAALSLALLDEMSVEAALARGVAAGSANALALGAGMLDPDVARRLEDDVVVTTSRR